MLPRHARGSVSAHRHAFLRSIGAPSRCSALRSSQLPALARQYMITRQFRPWRRRSSDSSHGNFHERHLATAVDEFKLGGMPYNHIPDLAFSPFQPPPPLRSHDFQTFDQSPLRIPEPLGPRPATRMNTLGIPGEADDMLPVFDACIRVGKLERAALVLKRFIAMGTLEGEQQILLHNQYLRSSLQHMRTSPDPQQAEGLHKWYELQIRHKNLPHTAETIACMLKASLISERGSRLDRLVSRYMGMAPGEAGLSVLSMADILSDQDLAIITEICPTYNFTAEAESEALAAEESHEDPESAEFGVESKPRMSGPVPELLVTPQRGEGLNTLKKGLRLLAELQEVDTSKLTDSDRYELQLQLEQDSITSAIDKWRHEAKNLQKLGINTALGASTEEGSLSQVMATWLIQMESKLKEEFTLIEESENKADKSEQDLARCFYGPIIRQVDPARLAAVTILSILNLGAVMGIDKGIPVSKLITNTGKLAQEDIQLQQQEKREKTRKSRKIRYTGTPAGSTEGAPNKHETQSLLPDAQIEHDLENTVQQPWSLLLRTQVGSILLKLLVETAQIKAIRRHPTTDEIVSQEQPAFTHRQAPRKGKKVGVMLLNEVLMEKLKREPLGDYLAKHLPMIVEPRPWRLFTEGGFLDSKTSFVRLKAGDVEQKLYTNAAIKRGDMDKVFKGLDVLGKTAWNVNSDMLKVMMEAWNSGDEIANMPPLNPDLPTPAEPDSSADPLQRRIWARAVKSVENERSGLHSQRCFMNLQLEVARTFRNQTIYFPHNIDYRGRAYPMPTYLNHMGADHSRALLRFASGKELGTRGLRWLKIHLANVWGLDKASFDDREAFTTEHVAEIVESATNPLNGNKWWLKAEDPWQCLAACFELKAALELPDPTTYVSHLPVHQDGTCNGLQHYAALGGDSWGAKQVNLEPGDKPADVYSAVADLVKEGIAKDAQEKNPFAVTLEGKITRKVVKQTVMTNVYGVTFQGAKKQVCKQLDALYPNIGKESGISSILLATYIAKHIFNALASMFRGAHDIQYWLGEIGGRVCRAMTPAQLEQISDAYIESTSGGTLKGKKKSAALANVSLSSAGKKGFNELVAQFRSTVVWTTPLRMPVAQPYRKSSMKEIRTCLQSVIYPSGEQTDPVNRKKQLQGFPPNFIHSLDASHMLLSALQCYEQGLTFAAVHDSFWTHAADVDVMNGVIRDAFIQIHEEDVVGRLASEFEARHKGSLYLAHIDSKSPVANKIKELRKKSKLTPKEELLLEHKRNTLRLSGHPWDLETAKQIITPASVYEDMKASEEDVDIHDQLKEIVLGEIPETEPLPLDCLSAADLEKFASKTDDDVLDRQVADSPHENLGEDEDVEFEEDAEDVDSESGSSSFADNMIAEMGSSQFENRLLKPKRSVPKRRPASTQIWLPLTIPAIPKKGDFDVTRLRDSKYFFS